MGVQNKLMMIDAMQQITDDAKVHDDVIKWKHVPRYWPFVRGIHW